MALVKCTECGKDVAELADKCPHCGLNREPWYFNADILRSIAVLTVLAIVGLWYWLFRN